MPSSVDWIIHGQGRALIKSGLANAYKSARTCLRKSSLALVLRGGEYDGREEMAEYVTDLKSNPTLIVNCNVKCVVIYMLH